MPGIARDQDATQGQKSEQSLARISGSVMQNCSNCSLDRISHCRGVNGGQILGHRGGVKAGHCDVGLTI